MDPLARTNPTRPLKGRRLALLLALAAAVHSLWLPAHLVLGHPHQHAGEARRSGAHAHAHHGHAGHGHRHSPSAEPGQGPAQVLGASASVDLSTPAPEEALSFAALEEGHGPSEPHRVRDHQPTPVAAQGAPALVLARVEAGLRLPERLFLVRLGARPPPLSRGPPSRLLSRPRAPPSA